HNNAPVFHAGEGGDCQHRLEGKANVGALARRNAVRNQIKTLQAQDVIEPNRSRVAHGRLQHMAKWLELLILYAGRIEPSQTPVLSRSVENIRRRTNCHPRQNCILIAPSIEPLAANSNRDLPLKPTPY